MDVMHFSLECCKGQVQSSLFRAWSQICMVDRTILIQNPHNLVQAFVRSPALWDLLPRKPGKKCVSRSFVADQTNCSHNTAMLRRNLLIMDGSPPDVVDRGIVRQAGFFGPSCCLSPDSCGRKWQEAVGAGGLVCGQSAGNGLAPPGATTAGCWRTGRGPRASRSCACPTRGTAVPASGRSRWGPGIPWCWQVSGAILQQPIVCALLK